MQVWLMRGVGVYEESGCRCGQLKRLNVGEKMTKMKLTGNCRE